MLQALVNTTGNKRKKSRSTQGVSPTKRKTSSRHSRALNEALQPIADVLKLNVEAAEKHAERMSDIVERTLEHQRKHTRSMDIFRRESAKFDRILAAVAAGLSFQEATKIVCDLTTQ